MATTEPLRNGRPEWDGQEFSYDDPRIPPAIRQSVAPIAQTDDRLYFSDTKEGGEWWLLDGEGELVESFRLVD